MRNIVHTYRGLLQPLEGGDVTDEQISLAHQYFNKLIKIEHERRQAVLDVQREVPEVAAKPHRSGAMPATDR